jgi:hypothetical protein
MLEALGSYNHSRPEKEEERSTRSDIKLTQGSQLELYGVLKGETDLKTSLVWQMQYLGP